MTGTELRDRIGSATRMALGAALICGATATGARNAAAEEDPFKLGVALFNEHCAVCHSGSPESLAFGPPLHDIIGRAAATQEEYEDYSDALKASGLVFDEETLRAFIHDNTELVEGSNMPVIGLEAAEIDALMVYLRFISE